MLPDTSWTAFFFCCFFFFASPRTSIVLFVEFVSHLGMTKCVFLERKGPTFRRTRPPRTPLVYQRASQIRAALRIIDSLFKYSIPIALDVSKNPFSGTCQSFIALDARNSTTARPWTNALLECAGARKRNCFRILWRHRRSCHKVCTYTHKPHLQLANIVKGPNHCLWGLAMIPQPPHPLARVLVNAATDQLQKRPPMESSREVECSRHSASTFSTCVRRGFCGDASARRDDSLLMRHDAAKDQVVKRGTFF